MCFLLPFFVDQLLVVTRRHMKGHMLKLHQSLQGDAGSVAVLCFVCAHCHYAIRIFCRDWLIASAEK